MERKKLELELNKPVKIELLNDQCLIGTSRYGEYYLYGVRNGGNEELSYFADKEVHEKIRELHKGDKAEICKRAEQKGTKIITSYDVKVLQDKSSETNTDKNVVSDNYFDIMLSSCRDAVCIQNELGGLMDAKSLAVTLFIARSKINGNGY